MPVMTKSPAGEDIVILSRKEYDQLKQTAWEDAEDARIATDIMARNEETLTLAEVDELLTAKSPLAFWRKRRGLTQAQLAKSAKIAQGFVSEIESGRKTGDVKTLKQIAATLNVTLLDLVDVQRSDKTVSNEKKTARKTR